MENLIGQVFQNWPSLAGLIVLAWVLYRQNERLMTAVLDDIKALTERVEALEVDISQLRNK
jgi:hypothetical protein